MGIVNVTPDSFSDGGQHWLHETAVDHAGRLLEEGADIIDIGGESTRPGAPPVSEDEELRRVLPVIESVVSRWPRGLVSVDTQKPAVARAAISAGAGMINDVAANRDDPAMWELAAETGAGYVAMHMQGTPQTMQQAPQYEDVVRDVAAFFEERLERFAHAGLPPEQVVLDVGIGFGKTVEQNVRLLAAISSFQKFNRPVLLGASRKSFIGRLTGAGVEARLPGSLAVAVMALRDGVQMLRVHDVAATRQALIVAGAILDHSV